MLNQVALLGEVVTIHQDTEGDTYLALAIERDHKDHEGKYLVDIIHCRVWKGMADSVRKYYKEGQYLSICGRLEENETMRNLVVAEKVAFAGRTTKGQE